MINIANTWLRPKFISWLWCYQNLIDAAKLQWNITPIDVQGNYWHNDDVTAVTTAYFSVWSLNLSNCKTEMAWSPWLMIFVIIACLMIIAIFIIAVIYFRIDSKRRKMLRGLFTNFYLPWQSISQEILMFPYHLIFKLGKLFWMRLIFHSI